MQKNMKSQNKNKRSTKIRGLTGHEVVAKIFGVSVRWVSKVLTGQANDKNGYEYELQRYVEFQRGYILRRKHELGIDNNKDNTSS